MVIVAVLAADEADVATSPAATVSRSILLIDIVPPSGRWAQSRPLSAARHPRFDRTIARVSRSRSAPRCGCCPARGPRPFEHASRQLCGLVARRRELAPCGEAAAR